MTLDSLAKNIPGLDGLRGLAVVAVILLHADVPGCAGGFIGVDVFFVLSGFLITGLLLRERVTSGRVKLSHFYMRRALRLLPALVGLVLALALVVFARAPASWRYPFFLDSLATLFYSQNLARGLGWLPPGLYAHLWSLSIEEHFYLVWPLILVATTPWGPGSEGS